MRDFPHDCGTVDTYVYMKFITPRYRHVISLYSPFHWVLSQTENISKMAHIDRLHVCVQLMGFTPFLQQILCGHRFRGQSYIT